MRQALKFKILLVFVGLLLVPIAYASEHSLRLVIRDSVELRESGPLLLKHIMEPSDLSAELLAHLRSVELGRIPDAGEQLVLSNAAISQVLRRHVARFAGLGAETSKPSYQIPRQVVVKNVSHLLDQVQVRKKLMQHWGALCPQDCEVSIAQLNLPRIVAPSGSWTLRLGDDLPRGSFSLALEVENRSSQPQIHWIHGRIEVRRKVPVTTRALNFGERVSSQDITWEMRDMTLARDATPSEEQLLGQRLRSSLAARSVIYSQQVERPRAVQRGQLARVTRGEGLWQITSQALAEQDGFIGDRINLRHPRTQALLSGVVVADGEVELK